jgi:hypothetical protein
MENNPTITEKNVFEKDIEKLAMASRFGDLKFENANNKLSKAQQWLKEASDLNYKELLLENDSNQVNNQIKNLAEHLEWLRNFDLKTPNPSGEHDSFEGRVDGFYDTVYQNTVMKYLPFLREERRREQPDEKKLNEEVRKASQLRTELEEELKKVKEDIEKIKTTEKKVGTAKGERAATKLSEYFDDEVVEYQKKVDLWFKFVIGGYSIIVLILAIIARFYFVGRIPLSWEVVIAKLVLIAALWYGLSFIIKNYNVSSHLVAVNRHRAAVSKTLEDFMAAEQDKDSGNASEILRSATDAMFKHTAIGFVSKTEKETTQPILQVVNDLMGIKNQ